MSTEYKTIDEFNDYLISNKINPNIIMLKILIKLNIV